MAVLQAASVADNVVGTLHDLGKLKMSDLSSDYQETVALKRILTKGKVDFLDDGDAAQFNIVADYNHGARSVGLAYTAQVDMPNLLTTGVMPWRHSNYSWGIERRLAKMNSGKSRIVNLVDTQRRAAMGGFILYVERLMWRSPSLTEFDTDPVGIPYFVCKSATATSTNDGFNGNTPTGHTTVAGITPATVSLANAMGRYRNYAAPYVDVSATDLFRGMRRAKYKTDFAPLVDGTPVYHTGNDYGIYCRYDTVAQIEELLETRNDNLGKDVAPYDGKASFMRTPFTPVKHLDYDSTYPVYMLNWGSIGAVGLRGEFNNEQTFDKNPNQPTVTFTVCDYTWNMICRDRRRQAVLSIGTADIAA